MEKQLITIILFRLLLCVLAIKIVSIVAMNDIFMKLYTIKIYELFFVISREIYR